MSYSCYNCGKEIKSLEIIRCPYCGSRIIFKARAPVVRKTKTD